MKGVDSTSSPIPSVNPQDNRPRAHKAPQPTASSKSCSSERRRRFQEAAQQSTSQCAVSIFDTHDPECPVTSNRNSRTHSLHPQEVRMRRPCQSWHSCVLWNQIKACCCPFFCPWAWLTRLRCRISFACGPAMPGFIHGSSVISSPSCSFMSSYLAFELRIPSHRCRRNETLNLCPSASPPILVDPDL